MKRTCLVLTCLAVAAVLVGPAQSAETFARYVPDGAVLYATTQNLESVWQSIEQSTFWNTFTHLNIWEGADFGWYEEFRNEFAENVGFEFSTENVMAVFGKEFAVALYIEPAAAGEDGPTIEVLCLAQMNPPDRVEEMIGKLLDRAKEEGGDEVIISSIEHAGTRVQTIRTQDDVPPVQLRLAMKDGVLIVGLGNTVPRIEACLDCMAGTGTPLAGSDTFARLSGMAHQDRGVFFGEMYFSMTSLQPVVAQLADEEPEFVPLAEMFEMLVGTSEAMVMTTHLDHGLRMQAAVEPGAQMSEMMALMRKAAPSAGTHMKYVVPDALIYYGSNSMPPLGELWPYMMEMWSKFGGFDEYIRDGIEQIELALGIDFEADFLNNLGTEMGFVLEGVDMEAGPFPFPKLTFLVQVNDRATAQALIDKLVGLIEEAAPPEAGLTVTDLTHQGSELKVVGVPVPFLQIELTPTIGITENFLFISSGEEYAKATLNAAKGGAGLVNSPLYRSLGIPEKTNGLMLVNMDELLKVGRQVTGWVVTMAEMQGRGDVAKEQVDDYVLPLLDCLGVFKAIACYGIYTPEGAIAVYVIRVEDLPVE